VEAALLDAAEWSAVKYITSRPKSDDEKHGDEQGNRPIRFRKTFDVPEHTTASAAQIARLHVTALGVYEAFLNGQSIGNECLAPGWTSYEHRIQYQVFDIGPLLRPGQNTLMVEAAEGWYSGRLT
jgi:alpha-L-rhamnosidase